MKVCLESVIFIFLGGQVVKIVPHVWASLGFESVHSTLISLPYIEYKEE